MYEKTSFPYKLDAIAAFLIDMDDTAPVLLVIRPGISVNPRIFYEAQRRYLGLGDFSSTAMTKRSPPAFHLRRKVGIGQLQVMLHGDGYAEFLVFAAAGYPRRTPLLIGQLQSRRHGSLVELFLAQDDPFAHVREVRHLCAATTIEDAAPRPPAR